MNILLQFQNSSLSCELYSSQQHFEVSYRLSLKDSMLVLALLCLFIELACATAGLSPRQDLYKGKGSPLASGFAKPPNVDTDLDCAIKSLAYNYTAFNLMPSVSI